MRSFCLTLLLLCCATVCRAQPKFTKEQLCKDADVLYGTILDVHPYMFTNISKEAFEAGMKRAKEQMTDSMTVFDFYRVFAPVVAKLGDGHTGLDYPFDLAARHGIEILPYSFTIGKADTTLIVREGLDGKIGSGSRVLSINGVPVKELIVQTGSMLSGEAWHFKMEVLNIAFSPLLQLILPAEEYRVEYLDNGRKRTATVAAKPLSECMDLFLASLAKETLYGYEIDEDSNTAILTIDSFDIYGQEGKYRNFLDSLFREISEKQIGNLIVDIRRNGGGLENMVWELFQYISPAPFQTTGPSIEKVSETVKKEFNLEALPGVYMSGSADLIPLRENPLRYSGPTYLLTSGFTFSSATKLAWAFKYFGMGRIIGEETGGQVVSYGNVFNTDLPNTRLPYGISRWKLYCYGASEDQKHGVIPHIPVPADRAMDTALEIIRSQTVLR